MLCLLCNYLVDKFDITIIIHSAGKSFFQLDSRVHIVLLRGNILEKNWNIYKILKRMKCEYFISLDSNSVIVNGFLLPRFTKLILWEHFSLENNLNKTLFILSRYYISLRSKYIIVLSELEKKMWNKQYGARLKKIMVLYNPTPLKIYPENKFNRYNNKTIIAIGNNIEVKGFDLLLKAWSKIKTDWLLKIIGLSDHDKNLLSDMIHKQNISNAVVLGRESKINFIYENASLFVLSSRKEATPLVLIESQSFGLPVIAFDHLTSVKEIAGNSILYASFKDKEDALVKKIVEIIESPEIYNKFHHRSLANSNQFTQKSFEESWLNLLK